MKREIHGSTDVTSHFIEQAWILATATALASINGKKFSRSARRQFAQVARQRDEAKKERSGRRGEEKDYSASKRRT